MANRRNRPTLYEVVSRNRRERQAARPAGAVVPAAPAVSESATSTGGGHSSETARAAAIRAAAASVAAGRAAAERPHFDEPGFAVGQPIVTLSDARVQFSLSALHAVFLPIGFAAMLFLSYWFGRQSVGDAARRDLTGLTAGPTAQPAPVGEVPLQVQPENGRSERGSSRTRREEPLVVTDPPRPQPETPAAAIPPPPTPREAAPAPAAPPRSAKFAPEAGKYYVVAQHFFKDRRADAEKARAYLIENGVPSELLGTTDIQLTCTQPFDSKPEGESLVAKVKELGTKYAGGYRFAGCYTGKIRSK